MPETSRRLTWVRAGYRYPDLVQERDYFLALDEGGREIGSVRLVNYGPDYGRWVWSMLLTHPGPAFKQPTRGIAKTHDEAAVELLECWRAFREWFAIED